MAVPQISEFSATNQRGQGHEGEIHPMVLPLPYLPAATAMIVVTGFGPALLAEVAGMFADVAGTLAEVAVVVVVDAVPLVPSQAQVVDP